MVTGNFSYLARSLYGLIYASQEYRRIRWPECLGVLDAECLIIPLGNM